MLLRKKIPDSMEPAGLAYLTISHALELDDPTLARQLLDGACADHPADPALVCLDAYISCVECRWENLQPLARTMAGSSDNQMAIAPYVILSRLHGYSCDEMPENGELLNALQKSHPKNRFVMLITAMAHATAGDYDQCLPILPSVLEMPYSVRSTSAVTHLLLAEVFEHCLSPEQARRHREHANRTDATMRRQMIPHLPRPSLNAN
jgi:hypothetical protein